MPSVISHGVVGAALGTVFRTQQAPRRFWLLGIGCAMLPDLDSLTRYLDIPRGHLLAHRGITHSLPFALVVSALVVGIAFRGPQWQGVRARLLLYFFLATASHGILDALTNGGQAIPFFAPFDMSRYFFSVRPIEVSPLSISRFLGERGLVILVNEIGWLWLPSLALAGGAWLARRPRKVAGNERKKAV